MNTTTKPKEAAKVYIEAYAASDNGDGPRFAEVWATQEFLARLNRLSGLCTEHSLSELRVFDSPEAWGPGDVAEDLRLTGGELVVTENSFWFVDAPKNTDYHIETRAQNIAQFCDMVKQLNGDTAYLGEDPDLEICVEEAQETSGAEKPAQARPAT